MISISVFRMTGTPLLYTSCSVQQAISHTWQPGDGDQTDLNYMRFLHRFGFLKTAILSVEQLLPCLQRVTFVHLQPTAEVKPSLPHRLPTDWPAPQPPRVDAERPFNPQS